MGRAKRIRKAKMAKRRSRETFADTFRRWVRSRQTRRIWLDECAAVERECAEQQHGEP